MGFASASSADELIALLQACLAEAVLDAGQLIAIGTHKAKLTSPLLLPLALHFGVLLRLFDEGDLRDAGPGVAESVAGLAGPVLLSKRKSAFATCALARCTPGFSLGDFGQPFSSSAMMAASTLLASRAGP
jgi:hypothetical protein